MQSKQASMHTRAVDGVTKKSVDVNGADTLGATSNPDQ